MEDDYQKEQDQEPRYGSENTGDAGQRPLWVSIVVIIAKLLVGLVVLIFLLFAALFIACVYG